MTSITANEAMAALGGDAPLLPHKVTRLNDSMIVSALPRNFATPKLGVAGDLAWTRDGANVLGDRA